MKVHPSITEERLIEAIAGEQYVGFCLACGADQGGVEPDARNYKCSACGLCEVYGAEEVLLMVA
jgi:hypothetical protein